MAVLRWGQQSGATHAKLPVILWHGMTRNSRDFDRLAQELAKDRLVLCPDTPGRGISPWLEDKSNYNYVFYFELACALVEHYGLAAYDWVGISMGGRIGMGIACPDFNPEPVRMRRLVVNDIGPVVPAGARKRIIKYTSNPPQVRSMKDYFRAIRIMYGTFGITDPSFWTHLAAYSMRPMDDGRITMNYDPEIVYTLRQEHGDNFERDVWKEYASIPCPILVQHGAKSDLLTLEVAERMVASHHQTQLISYDDAGHSPAYDTPGRIDPVIAFLDAA